MSGGSTGERPFSDIITSIRYWIIHSITIPALFVAGFLFISTGLAYDVFGTPRPNKYCIDHTRKNMKGLKRILKKGGVITAQVGSNDKKPKQVDNWCKVLSKSFGNVRLSGAYIPSFDCNWNFASSIMK